MAKAFASRAAALGSISVLAMDLFSRSSHTSDLDVGTPVAILCQAPGAIGSALELVGPASVYGDWMR